MSTRDYGGTVNAFDLIKVIWSSRWIVLITTLLPAIAAVAYVLLATEWYRAEVLLAPANSLRTTPDANQLGALTSLVGIEIANESTVEPIAILRSRAFARSFIEDKELLTVFLADQWDEEEQSWRGDDESRWPDIRDGVEYFLDDMIRVSEERPSGLVRLSIDWTDPALAADWANDLVRRLNDNQRQRALAEAEANIAYLQSEFHKTSIVALQQSIGRLLETEFQKVMLARGTEEFAFRVIDHATPPIEDIRPRGKLIVSLATFLGMMLSVFYVLLAQEARTRSKISQARSRD